MAHAPPSVAEVRKDLSRSVLYGITDSAWVKEFAGARLFRLPSVIARVDDDAPTEDQLAAAFTATVREAVAHVGSPQYRILLTIVLAVDEDYLSGREQLVDLPAGTKINGDMPLKQRRELAGKLFREGKRPVTWGAIRSYHEPRALDLLAAVLTA